MGTDAGETDAEQPGGTEDSESSKRRSTFRPPVRPRPDAPSRPGEASTPSEPRTSDGLSRHQGDEGVNLPVSEPTVDEPPGEESDDPILRALEKEVTLLTASLPIIRPGSLFTTKQREATDVAAPAEPESEAAPAESEPDAAPAEPEAIVAPQLPSGAAEPGLRVDLGETGPEPGTGASAEPLPVTAPLPEPTTRSDPEQPAFQPVSDAEREISAEADKGDTLAAIERLEALLAGRRAAVPPVPPTEPTPTPPPPADLGELAATPIVATYRSTSTSEIPVVSEDELDADVNDDADDVVADDFSIVPIASPRVRAGEGVLSTGHPTDLPVFSIEQTGIEPTPLEYRAGKASRLFWLWFAVTASIVVMALGAVLVSAGLNAVQVLIAAVVGIALSFIPLGLSALTGVWSGQPTVVVSRATFGVVGNIVPSVLVLIVRLFWGAMLLWLLVITIADAAVGAGWVTDRAVVEWPVFAVGIAVCVVVAVFGFALVAVVQLIAAVASAVLGLAVIVLTWPGSGWDAVGSAPYGEWILVVEGIVLVFSVLGLAWASAGGDLARYQRAGSGGTSTALWTGLGASLPLLIFVAYGAVFSLAQPGGDSSFSADPVRRLVASAPHWVAVPVVAAIAIGLLSALVVNIYSGGFVVQTVGVHLPRWATVVVLGALVAAGGAVLIAAVPGIRTFLLSYPTTLAVPLAAWTGIFFGDFLLRRRRLATDSLLQRGGVYPDWRWVNVAGLVVITLIGWGFMRADALGLRWEGYWYALLGGDPHGVLAGADLGVLLALALGLALALIAGRRDVAAQESASR